MPTQACRNIVHAIARGGAEHAGLVLSRYLRVRVPAGKDEKEHPKERQLLFTDAINACRRAHPLYNLAYRRWKKDIEQAAKAFHEMQVRGRLIVGLGGENVLGTGITLHHTYGTPLIPGTALKGLAAHYCADAWGSKCTDFKKDEKYYTLLFGTTEDSGHIVFHDAWIAPESLVDGRQGLVRDVMTPHHGKYYMADPPSKPPADFDMPIPVPFLAVSGTFLVAVSSDITDPKLAQQWCDLALNILSEALQNWGVGGKTNAGYGQMVLSAGAGAGSGGDKPARLRFKAGDAVAVTCIEDPKGGSNVWFEAEDGFRGMIRTGETPPGIKVREKTSLYVSSVTVGHNKGYIFSAQPVQPKPLPKNKPIKKR